MVQFYIFICLIMIHRALDEEECGILINIACERMLGLRRESAVIMSRRELKENLQRIVDKYIAKDSEYSINIKSKTRMKILQHFADHVVPKYGWMDTVYVYLIHVI